MGLACAYQATVQYSQRTVLETGTQTGSEVTMVEIETQTTRVIAQELKRNSGQEKQWVRIID